MVGVLVDGIGREVKEFLLHPQEDELLPSQRAAAAAAAAAPDASADGGGGDASAKALHAAAGGAGQPPAAGFGVTPVAAAPASQAAGQLAQQAEHLPVLAQVVREAPEEVSNC